MVYTDDAPDVSGTAITNRVVAKGDMYLEVEKISKKAKKKKEKEREGRADE